MALIDQIKQMKQMGYGDGDIASSLQSRGVSPREINDAMSQLKIREAVTNPGIQSVNVDETMQSNQDNMQQSIANQYAQANQLPQQDMSSQNYDLGAAMQPQGQETQQYPVYDQAYGYGPEYTGSQEMSKEMNAQTQGYAGSS